MNFLLSDEQNQLFDTVLRFASEQGGGNCARRMFDAGSDLDPGLWKGLMDLGIAGIPVAEADGGLGLELIDLAIVCEALGRRAVPGPYLGHLLATCAIARLGNDDQKARLLPGLLSGDVIGAMALDGPDPDRWLMNLEGSRLDGTCRNVPGGLEAGLLVVGIQAGGLAIVSGDEIAERIPLDSADRTRRLADIRFEGAAAELLSSDQQSAASIVDIALILLAADAYGGACQCLDMAVDYAKVREQFGQPIGAFQGLKFQLADLAVEVEPARGLYWFAAHAFDHHADRSRHAAAAAKAHICDVYRRATRATIEAHGGIGYTWEHDAQIYFKRAMFDFAWLGTPAEHRVRQAALAEW